MFEDLVLAYLLIQFLDDAHDAVDELEEDSIEAVEPEEQVLEISFSIELSNQPYGAE